MFNLLNCENGCVDSLYFYGPYSFRGNLSIHGQNLHLGDDEKHFGAGEVPFRNEGPQVSRRTMIFMWKSFKICKISFLMKSRGL